MLRVKGSDTLCPVGPALVTGWDFRGKRIRTYVNGEVVQDGNTARWSGHALPRRRHRPQHHAGAGGPAALRHPRQQPAGRAGDVVAVEVEGLGRLENEIVRGPEPIREDLGAQPGSSEDVVSTALGGDWEFRGIRAPRGPGAKHYRSRLEE